MAIRDSLQDRLDEGTAGTLPERMELALQIARILRGWHRMGKYHGRLTADAVFLRGRGRVTLANAEPSPEPASEAGDVRAFGEILESLLAEAGEELRVVAELSQEAQEGRISMKQVVAVLEEQAGGPHAAYRWLERNVAGAIGVLAFLTAAAWLSWLASY